MVRRSGGLPGSWKVWFFCATDTGSVWSNRFAVPTSCRTNGLLPSARPGFDGSKPGLGFLSVKNCRPTPGPPLCRVVEDLAPALGRRGLRVRVLHELGEGVDEIGHVGEADAGVHAGLRTPDV